MQGCRGRDPRCVRGQTARLPGSIDLRHRSPHSSPSHWWPSRAVRRREWPRGEEQRQPGCSLHRSYLPSWWSVSVANDPRVSENSVILSQKNRPRGGMALSGCVRRGEDSCAVEPKTAQGGSRSPGPGERARLSVYLVLCGWTPQTRDRDRRGGGRFRASRERRTRPGEQYCAAEAPLGASCSSGKFWSARALTLRVRHLIKKLTKECARSQLGLGQAGSRRAFDRGGARVRERPWGGPQRLPFRSRFPPVSACRRQSGDIMALSICGHRRRRPWHGS